MHDYIIGGPDNTEETLSDMREAGHISSVSLATRATSVTRSPTDVEAQHAAHSVHDDSSIPTNSVGLHTPGGSQWLAQALRRSMRITGHSRY
jgi:hypothetical protein